MHLTLLLELRYYSAPDSEAEYCDKRVCLSVCVCVILSDLLINQCC